MGKSDYIKNGRYRLRPETFAVAKARTPLPGAFANIIDGREVTVVAVQNRIEEIEKIDIERGWRIITFDMVLPFELTGFLASVSAALASKGVSIFALSSFSTDHILVKADRLDTALKTLEELGFKNSSEN